MRTVLLGLPLSQHPNPIMGFELVTLTGSSPMCQETLTSALPQS